MGTRHEAGFGCHGFLGFQIRRTINALRCSHQVTDCIIRLLPLSQAVLLAVTAAERVHESWRTPPAAVRTQFRRPHPHRSTRWHGTTGQGIVVGANRTPMWPTGQSRKKPICTWHGHAHSAGRAALVEEGRKHGISPAGDRLKLEGCPRWYPHDLGLSLLFL
jgi:hypothetical protein